jgi:hypothetical protein
MLDAIQRAAFRYFLHETNRAAGFTGGRLSNDDRGL